MFSDCPHNFYYEYSEGVIDIYTTNSAPLKLHRWIVMRIVRSTHLDLPRSRRSITTSFFIIYFYYLL